MKKHPNVTDADKAAIRALVAKAWNATKNLPLAPAGLAESAVFYHDNNPCPPMMPADPMDGRPGKGSCAHNAILLHCAGYRVPSKLIAGILAGYTFGGHPHANTANHTKDLASVKVGAGGHFAICATDGWQACNPDWLSAIGRALPEATMEAAPGLEAAAAALPVADKPLKPGKAPRGANKGNGKGKPSRKAIEETASAADLAAGRAITE